MNYDHNLGHFFDFNDDDLKANRAGQLSTAQLQRFKRRHQGCLLWGWIVSWVFIVLTAIAYFTQTNPQSDLPITLLIIAVICTVGMLAVTWAGDNKYYLRQISGEGRLSQDRGEQAIGYNLNIKGYIFSLTEKQYNQLEDGMNYTVYYATTQPDHHKQKTAVNIIQSLEQS